MNSSLAKAKLLLAEGNTCALVSENCALVSKERGVVPLLRFLDGGQDFSDFFAADKVVGKAAAALYVKLNVRGIYADVISVSAAKLLQANGIGYVCGTTVQSIVNRKGDGLCPMELASMNISDLDGMVSAIRQTAGRLGIYPNEIRKSS
ncbi:MAG: DUF1893 domain-containing protein [Corallococcus sp.]|nr:DUF1893 domain-containing protein [Corallococcus sp.]